MRFGNYVVGSFVGVVDGDFPRLEVRTGEPSADRPGFVERLEFSPYDQRSGEPVLRAGVEPGDVVVVRVALVARLSAAGKPFVSKRVLSVDVSESAPF
jgi:hypothetical protein